MLATTLSLLTLAAGRNVPSGPAETIQFQTIKDLLPRATSSSATALSPDGTTLVGTWGREKLWYAFVLQDGRTVKTLKLPPNSSGFYGTWVGAGGKSVCGDLIQQSGDHVAARWSADTQGFKLCNARSSVRDVSDDGKVIVGNLMTARRELIAVRFGPDLKAARLPRPEASPFASAYAVSGDGKVIAGMLGMRPVRWIGKRLEPLAPPEPGTRVVPSAVNRTGSVIVGSRQYRARLNGSEFPVDDAFVWIQGKGIRGLGFLPKNGDFPRRASANAVSADGLLVAGYCEAEEIPVRDKKGVVVGSRGIDSAFIWDEKHGLRDLQKVLTARYGADWLHGWRLCSVTGMSADGKTLVGSAFNGEGFDQSYVLKLPVRPDKL